MAEQTSRTYALVTGASEGIGFALTKQLIKQHYVIAVSRSLGQLASINSHKFSHWSYDLSIDSERNKLIARVEQSLPFLNLLVNNAGVQQEFGLTADNWHAYRQEIALNLTTPIHLTLGLKPSLLSATAPLVINLGSVLGFCHRKASPVYSVTKAGIHQFSNILAADEPAISVLEVIPPMVATNMTKIRGHKGLMSADELAVFICRNLDKTGCLYVGKARMAKLLAKLVPGILAKMINKTGNEFSLTAQQKD